MPKFTFKNAELNNDLFKGGTNNFDGKYTPLTRTTASKSNDRLDGGSGASSSSGYSIDDTDISTTTEGTTHIVENSTTIDAPSWAKGITVQGHGAGGGGGGGGGNSIAWWYGDHYARGGDGGDGGVGGYGYLRKDVNENQGCTITIADGGGGGINGWNSHSPNNNAEGSPGSPGGNADDTTITIGDDEYIVGNGGNGGGRGLGALYVRDNQAGYRGARDTGGSGNTSGLVKSDWNNSILVELHIPAPGGKKGRGWYNASDQRPTPGQPGNKGKVIYRWNTSPVEEEHHYLTPS